MELQLFNSEQSLSLLELLISNDYIHIGHTSKNLIPLLSNLKDDLIHHEYEVVSNHKKTVTRTYIRIDEEDKTFDIITKLLDFSIVEERINKINKILKI